MQDRELRRRHEFNSKHDLAGPVRSARYQVEIETHKTHIKMCSSGARDVNDMKFLLSSCSSTIPRLF